RPRTWRHRPMATPATPDAPALEQRLNALETQNRRLRLVVAGIALGMVLYAAWYSLFADPIRTTVLEAQRVIVRDAAGRARVVLGTDGDQPDAFNAQDNPCVLLYDEQGALRARLSATAEVATLRLFDPDGRLRVALTHGEITSGVWL